jgi:hypothetical protein
MQETMDRLSEKETKDWSRFQVLAAVQKRRVEKRQRAPASQTSVVRTPSYIRRDHTLHAASLPLPGAGLLSQMVFECFTSMSKPPIHSYFGIPLLCNITFSHNLIIHGSDGVPNPLT